MTVEEAKAKALKAWNAYRKEADKKRKNEFLAAFKEAREEHLLAKESEKEFIHSKN